MFRFIREKTNPEDIVIFADPRIMVLYGERRSSHYVTFRQRQVTFEKAVKFFKDINADYWVTTLRYPNEPKYTNSLTHVFESGKYHVYKINV